MIDATVETFDELVREGRRAHRHLGSAVPTLHGADAGGRGARARSTRASVRFVKVNAPENRKVCRDLRVAGLPAYLTMRDGVEVERLTGEGTTPEQIEAAIDRLLGGAPAVGPPVPEHLRGQRHPRRWTDG